MEGLFPARHRPAFSAICRKQHPGNCHADAFFAPIKPVAKGKIVQTSRDPFQLCCFVCHLVLHYYPIKCIVYSFGMSSLEKRFCSPQTVSPSGPNILGRPQREGLCIRNAACAIFPAVFVSVSGPGHPLNFCHFSAKKGSNIHGSTGNFQTSRRLCGAKP